MIIMIMIMFARIITIRERERPVPFFLIDKKEK